MHPNERAHRRNTREPVSHETASATQLSKTSARIAFRLVVPTVAGTSAAVHAADTHFRRRGFPSPGCSPAPSSFGRLLTFRDPRRQPHASLNPPSEHRMTSTQRAHSEMPIPSRNSPAKTDKSIEAGRRDTNFNPARLRPARQHLERPADDARDCLPPVTEDRQPRVPTTRS